MKLPSLFLIATSLLATPLIAQDSAGDELPQVDSAIDEGSVGRLQLIPDTAPESTDFDRPDAPARGSANRATRPSGPSETQKAIEDQERKVALRRARIRAEKDPAVREALTQAEYAATDAERRYAMSLYYDRLCDRMLRENGALKASIEELRSRSKRPLEQRNIRGSVWPPHPA